MEQWQTTLLAGLDRLDDDQTILHNEILYGEDAVTRVLAGAGSGKTTSVTVSVADAIHKGVFSPNEIALLTFTRAGRHAMEQKMKSMLPPGTKKLPVATFHSLAFSWIIRSIKSNQAPSEVSRWWTIHQRAEDQRIGWGKRIPACDWRARKGQTDQYCGKPEDLWIALLVGAKPGEEWKMPQMIDYRASGTQRTPVYPHDAFDQIDNFYRIIQRYEMGRRLYLSEGGPILGFDDDMAQRTEDYVGDIPGFTKALRAFERHRIYLGITEFSDSLYLYATHGTDRRKLVIIDETQDNSPVQVKIGQKLTSSGGRLIMVGDVRQSIYGFQGARPALIRDADQTMGAKTITLPNNYRSWPLIVAAGNAIANEESWSVGDPSRSARPNPEHQPGEIQVVSPETDDGANEQAIRMGGYISEQIKHGSATAGDFAILCRTNAMCDVFEIGCLINGLPVMRLGRSFGALSTKTVTGLFAWMLVVEHTEKDKPFPAQWLHLLEMSRGSDTKGVDPTILNFPPIKGIGDLTLRFQIGPALTSARGSLEERIEAATRKLKQDKRTAKVASGFHDEFMGLLSALRQAKVRFGYQGMLEVFARRYAGEEITDFHDFEHLIPFGARKTYRRTDLRMREDEDESEDPEAPLSLKGATQLFVRLAGSVDSFGALETIMSQQVPAFVGVSNEDDAASVEEVKKSRVSIATMHASKGLEWKHVIVLAESLWFAGDADQYSEKPSLAKDEVEESRRLFYVAVTRAESALTITWYEEAGQDYGPSPWVQDLIQPLADLGKGHLHYGVNNPMWNLEGASLIGGMYPTDPVTVKIDGLFDVQGSITFTPHLDGPTDRWWINVRAEGLDGEEAAPIREILTNVGLPDLTEEDPDQDARLSTSMFPSTLSQFLHLLASNRYDDDLLQAAKEYMDFLAKDRPKDLPMDPIDRDRLFLAVLDDLQTRRGGKGTVTEALCDDPEEVAP